MSVQGIIEEKLTNAFSVEFLKVENESHMHNVPAGSEMHFKVQIVSNDFEKESLIKRHRAINKVLEHELANNIHALSIHAFSKEEWAKRNSQTQDSPPCLGGAK